MQNIQLYIEGKRLELFKDESVVVTDTIKNLNTPDKLFAEYSKTFSLPATKANNKIFKHFYNSDILNGFDARVRAVARIELNDLSFKDGFVKLEGVDLKNNVAHTYRITFFGNTISLKNKFGDDSLSDLRWLNNFNTNQSGANIVYNPSNIETYATTQQDRVIAGVSYLKPIQVPLITHTQRLFYNSAQDVDESGNLHYTSSGDKGVRWDNLKYSIRLPLIVKAIEEEYDVEFSTDFFNESNTAWSDLFLWLHRTKGKPTNGGQEALTTSPVIGWSDSSASLSNMTNNVLTVVNSNNQTVKLDFVPNNAGSTSTYNYTIYRNNVAIITSGDVSGNAASVVPFSSNISDSYRVEISSVVEITFTKVEWVVTTSGNDVYTNTNFTKKDEFALVVTQQVPKMKVIDFLTAIFKAFNLVAYVDETVIVVKTLDDYYSSSNSYVIDKFIDTNKSQSNTSLPYSEIKYTYKGLGTLLAKSHEQINNQKWAELEFNDNSTLRFSGGSYNYVIPFEHFKFERLLDVDNPSPPTDIQWGFSVDDNLESYIGEPVIFYLARKSASISFVDQITDEDVFVTHKEINNYFAPCNSNMNIATFTNQPSINFKAEPDEWEGQNNLNTLFDSYHTEYISSIFRESNRVTKLTAYLPLKILLNYKLNDRFIVSGKVYKINSISTDLKNGKSKLELLNEL